MPETGFPRISLLGNRVNRAQTTLSSGSRNADYSPRMNKGAGGKGGEAPDPKHTKSVYPKAYVTNPPLVQEHSPEDEEQEKGLINRAKDKLTGRQTE